MKEQAKFFLAVTLETLAIVALFGGAWMIIVLSDIYRVLGGVIAIAGVIAIKPCDNLRQKAEIEKEYDEFGNSKKKSFKKLSRAERERIDMQNTIDMERILSTTDMQKRTKKGSLNPEKDMEELIGMDDVKQKMREMAARMKFNAEQTNTSKKKKSQNKPLAQSSSSGRHMIFDGPPGTGKTTMAEIFTGFLYEYGYIKQNKCVEVDGNFMKAGPDTSKKVELVVRQSFDGVLFIDEAYALIDDPIYGKDAVSSLIKQMEDNRGRFVLILAGYTQEIKRLLAANPGFQSRIEEFIHFPNYTLDELCDIFVLMAKKQGYVASKSALDAFRERITRESKKISFGNARTVRNVLTESVDKHALNFINGSYEAKEKFTLHESDVDRIPKRNDF